MEQQAAAKKKAQYDSEAQVRLGCWLHARAGARRPGWGAPAHRLRDGAMPAVLTRLADVMAGHDAHPLAGAPPLTRMPRPCSSSRLPALRAQFCASCLAPPVQLEWGGGLKQRAEAAARAAAMAAEAAKPFARSVDDAELDTLHRRRSRWGDPMVGASSTAQEAGGLRAQCAARDCRCRSRRQPLLHGPMRHCRSRAWSCLQTCRPGWQRSR